MPVQKITMRIVKLVSTKYCIIFFVTKVKYLQTSSRYSSCVKCKGLKLIQFLWTSKYYVDTAASQFLHLKSLMALIYTKTCKYDESAAYSPKCSSKAESWMFPYSQQVGVQGWDSLCRQQSTQHCSSHLW